MSQPLYRSRFEHKKVESEQVELARLYRRVFGSDEGRRVLDHVCNTLCGLDQPRIGPADVIALADYVARHNVGLSIATLALGQLPGPGPEVKAKPDG